MCCEVKDKYKNTIIALIFQISVFNKALKFAL